MSVKPGELVVLEVVREWVTKPPGDIDIEKDDSGVPWVRITAKAISETLLTQFNLLYSERRTRTALNGLVEKGRLLRTQRIGDYKWSGAYFYRLP